MPQLLHVDGVIYIFIDLGGLFLHDRAEMDGEAQVDQENAEANAHHKRRQRVCHEPLHQLPQPRIQQKVVRQRQHAPEEREQRADDALDIAPELAVVPQAQVEALEAHDADDILQQRHSQRHDDKHDRVIPERARKRAEQLMVQLREDEQQHRAESVQRQAGAEEEARVQPLALRVRPGEEPAEQKLQHPPADSAEEKQIQNDQEDLKFGHSRPPHTHFFAFSLRHCRPAVKAKENSDVCRKVCYTVARICRRSRLSCAESRL